jgi:hypothetical protein
MTLPRPREIRGKIDEKDLVHVRSRGINAVLAEPCPLGGNGKINPHVTRFHHKDGKITDVFHIKPVYYETVDHLWRPLSEVTAHYGNKMIVLKQDWSQKMSLRYFKWLMNRQRLFKNHELMIEGYVLQPRHMVFATDATFYPDANPESTTFDGWVRAYSNNFNTARTTSTGNDTNDYDASTVNHQFSYGSGNYYIVRTFFLFDTSSIPDGDTITSATFSWYFNSDTDGGNANDTNLALVSSDPASNTAIATGDYDATGSTSFGTMDAWTTNGQYNDITLNASGLANISKTGISKFAIVNANDLSATAPNGLNQKRCYMADNTGTDKDPKLVVTYTAGATANSGFFAFM